MAIHHGVGINWGVNSTISSARGLFQSRDHSIECERDNIRDGGDTTVSAVFYDLRERATFSYVAASPAISFLGNTAVLYPQLGQWVTVTDPTYSNIVGLWLVDNVLIASSNTSAARVTLQLSRYPYLRRR